MSYMYCGALYCEDCGRSILADIRAMWEARGEAITDLDAQNAEAMPVDVSYLSSESDSPEHCDCNEGCINAIEVGGRKVGAHLENDLTGEGRAYVKEAIARGSDVAREVWAPFYGMSTETDEEESEET